MICPWTVDCCFHITQVYDTRKTFLVPKILYLFKISISQVKKKMNSMLRNHQGLTLHISSKEAIFYSLMADKGSLNRNRRVSHDLPLWRWQWFVPLLLKLPLSSFSAFLEFFWFLLLLASDPLGTKLPNIYLNVSDLFGLKIIEFDY